MVLPFSPANDRKARGKVPACFFFHSLIPFFLCSECIQILFMYIHTFVGPAKQFILTGQSGGGEESSKQY